MAADGDGKSKRVKMRINCSGYQGEAVSVFGMFDMETDVLLIGQRAKKYDTEPRDGFLRITTQDRDPTHDGVFLEEQTRDAIVAFFELEAMNLIQFGEGLSSLDPKNKIERDGMDTGGMKYRIAPDISNGQVAVLIAAHTAVGQRAVGRAGEFFGDLMTI